MKDARIEAVHEVRSKEQQFSKEVRNLKRSQRRETVERIMKANEYKKYCILMKI